MMRKLIFLSLLIFWQMNTKAQDTLAMQSKTFTLNDLEELMMNSHPVIKQAQLLSDIAKAQVAQARGKFDPALQADFRKKYFGKTDYYNAWNSYLKVPLWLGGADLKLGYDRNVGKYTNPETSTSTSGLSSVGLSIPLGQGLIIDERRSVLRQAKAMLTYAEAEQVKQINSIWFTAVKDYWNWYYAYKQYELLREGVQLAEKRFEAIALQTELGDKPPIDSVEAAITVQERKSQLAKYTVELQNNRLLLSNHLWSNKQEPLELPNYATPDTLNANALRPDKTVLDTLLTQAQQQHPELIKLNSKSQQLDIEESYRKEMLKPKLNIAGNLISSRRNFNENIAEYYDFNFDNYKIGIEFAMPLFLRTERNKLKEVRLKQDQLSYDQLVTGRNIKNDINTKFNDLTAYSNQLRLQILSINNQQALLTGELQKFDLGESTLFIINSRESKLIDMRIKREDLISSYKKALAELYYKAGTRFTSN